ncbi:probable ATP-dependent RNA helicase DDX31 isoform X1 [Pteropus vampyrus]|uniref:ATP-dependent RNA helicase n=1 Tax=Pteropus vampyrus TaxID=132908 RepID=A0A6P6CXR9_PTEVA|nr:probable ATP-dependent RNA helicase DDX31 isoform X1 [Pteropus vampyrus]
MHSIPVLLEGRDALVRSQTGSGKTLAYCIPVVQSLQAMKTKIQRSDGPYALVLVPTRELALQSFDIFQKLLKPFTWIVPGVLMGGEKRKSEKARLRKGINILISTPGRLVDHIKSTKNIHFSRVQWLIVDEADRILDLGFEKDITVILNAVNAECQKRQNVLLSATLTEGVAQLADISLLNPVSISVLEEGYGQANPQGGGALEVSAPQTSDELDSFAIPEGLDQHVTLVPSKLRLVSLAAFILQKCAFAADQKMIVFFPSCELVEFHYTLFVQTLLPRPGAPAVAPLPSGSTQLKFLRLHGGLEQEDRIAVFQEFSHSKTGILLCTDVAARGLDLPQVTWIVQYNAPSSPAEYVHRVGRTARIGCRGSSLLILAPSEAEYVNSLASHKINVSEIKMEDILSVLTRDDCFPGKQWGKQKPRALSPQGIRERATVLQTVFEDYVHSSEQTVSWAKKGLTFERRPRVSSALLKSCVPNTQAGWRLASPRSESKANRPTRQPAERHVRDPSPAWAVGKSKRKNALREGEKPRKAYEGRDSPESCSKLFLPRTGPVALVALDRCPALFSEEPWDTYQCHLSLMTGVPATERPRPCLPRGGVSGAGSQWLACVLSRHLTSCVHSVSAHTCFTRRSDGAPTT